MMSCLQSLIGPPGSDDGPNRSKEKGSDKDSLYSDIESDDDLSAPIFGDKSKSRNGKVGW